MDEQKIMDSVSFDHRTQLQTEGNYEDRPMLGSDVFGKKGKIRKISLEELHRGYVLSVGCHTFAFSEKTELIDTLIKYINNPDETEKLWYDGKLFPDQSVKESNA